MAKEKEKEEVQSESLVVPQAQELETLSQSNDAALPVEFVAEINAQIENDLLAITTETVVAPKTLLNRLLTLHDAFLMTISGFADSNKNDDGTRIVFKVTDNETGLEYNVAQNPLGSRLSYVSAYNNARKIGRRLMITDVMFRETGKPKYGNMPIILGITATSKLL